MAIWFILADPLAVPRSFYLLPVGGTIPWPTQFL